MMETLKRDEPDESNVQTLCVNICIRNTISVSLHIYNERAKFDLIGFFSLSAFFHVYYIFACRNILGAAFLV